MNKELIQKIIRCFVVTLCFIGMLTAIGMQEREVQQWGFMLGLIVIFGLILRNIWLTLFLGWTVFLFAFFKFETGMIYVTNVFFGCLLYYLVKLAFKKEHINLFINAVLWFAVINIFYMALQISNFDFIYKVAGENTKNIIPTGFMGQVGMCGALLALCVPLLASRTSKLAIVGSLLLFIPLYICLSSISLWAAGIGLLFVLWFKLPKKIWFTIVFLIILVCIFFDLKIQHPGVSVRIALWKKVLSDCIKHPIVGWGLDSFRNITPHKNFLYRLAGCTQIVWDNPHNLIISLFCEFGLVGILLLIGYLRQCCIWFKNAVKEPNVIALFGFLVEVVIISQANFIMFLPRVCIIVIIGAALFEIAVKENS